MRGKQIHNSRRDPIPGKNRIAIVVVLCIVVVSLSGCISNNDDAYVQYFRRQTGHRNIGLIENSDPDWLIREAKNSNASFEGFSKIAEQDRASISEAQKYHPTNRYLIESKELLIKALSKDVTSIHELIDIHDNASKLTNEEIDHRIRQLVSSSGRISVIYGWAKAKVTEYTSHMKAKS
jgi:hypothetical protein